jgi:hypothetical protein
MKSMALTKRELKEWKSLYAKSKRHGIPIKRVSPYNSNVTFGENIYAQLGTGQATVIMDARIRLKKKKYTRVK